MYFFSFSFFAGLTILIAAFILKNKPPKNQNHWIGYRTRESLKSDENWKFAQTFSSKEYIKSGIFLIICGLGGYIATKFGFNSHWNSSAEMLASMFLIVTVLVYPIYRTEKELKARNL